MEQDLQKEQTTGPGLGSLTGRIDALDGLRAAAVLIIAWFHIWQQSWLAPVLETPFLTSFGIPYISLEALPRSGYLLVDLMLLLSGFCLFLPWARSALNGEPLPSAGSFYKKRLCRILPSYYACVLLIFFCVCLPQRLYPEPKFMLRDLLSTLTFTQTFFSDVYLGTRLNGVLWTAAIEMQFYLLFPLLARCFAKKPLLTFSAMTVIQEVYLRCYALQSPDRLRLTLNQLPGSLGIFALGMAGAYLYARISLRCSTRPRRWYRFVPLISVLLFIAACAVYWPICKGAVFASPVQAYQAQWRLPLGLVYLTMVLSLCFGGAFMKLLFGNPLARFLAGISYNLYLWHQWIAVQLKSRRIPYYAEDTPPNMTGDRTWMMTYTILCFALAIAAAALMTYGLERPVVRLLSGKRKPAPADNAG